LNDQEFLLAVKNQFVFVKIEYIKNMKEYRRYESAYGPIAGVLAAGLTPLRNLFPQKILSPQIFIKFKLHSGIL